MLSITLRLVLLASTQLLAHVHPVSARCAYIPPNATAMYDQWPLVLRLHYDPALEATADIPCEIPTYNNNNNDEEKEDDLGGYHSTTEGYTPYTIREVLKQNWSEMVVSSEDVPRRPAFAVGDAITVIYGTDTGYAKSIPSSIRDDPLGFVAYLDLEGDDNVCCG